MVPIAVAPLLAGARRAAVLACGLAISACAPAATPAETGSGGSGGVAMGGSSGAGGSVTGGTGGAPSAGSGGGGTAGGAGAGSAGTAGSGGDSAGTGGVAGTAGGGGSGGGDVLPKKINVLAIAEYDTNHGPFVEAAKPWLATLTDLTITYVENPNSITEEMLADYGLVLQLNYPPFAWDDAPKAAFEKYIDEGKGGWVGLHHASLYGSLVTDETWPWFYEFLGQVNFKGYIAEFAAADVHVEATSHPIFTGVPATFNVTTDEWYTWDANPRDHATVLATVDENSYEPDSAVKMGADHPVIWTNEAVAAKNVYIFMGHHPNLFENDAYKTLLQNAIFWAGTAAP